MLLLVYIFILEATMKKTALILLVAASIISLYILNTNNDDVNYSDQIAVAVDEILDDKEPNNIFTVKQKERLELFREKFNAENFDTYRIESYQAPDENVVYLMLIVDPTVETPGIVLYMTFELYDVNSLKVEKVTVSNWVTIEYEGKQF